MMTSMTSEQAAEAVWQIARDLASPRYSGTSLNAQRNVRNLALAIEAVAATLATDLQVTAVAKENVALKQTLNDLRSEFKSLRGELGQVNGKAKPTGKVMSEPVKVNDD